MPVPDNRAVDCDAKIDVGNQIAECYLKEATTAFTFLRDRISQIFNQTPAQTGFWVMSIARVEDGPSRDETKSCANSVALTDRTFAETSHGGDTSPYPVFSCPPAFDFKSAMIIGPSENSDCSVRRVRLRR